MSGLILVQLALCDVQCDTHKKYFVTCKSEKIHCSFVLYFLTKPAESPPHVSVQTFAR